MIDQNREANRLISRFADRLRATHWELIDKRQVEKFLLELSRVLSPTRQGTKPK